MKAIHYPNKIRSLDLGRNRTNGAIYFKINFKVEVCSSLYIFDSHPTHIIRYTLHYTLKSWRSENHTPIIIGLTKVNRHTFQ